MKEKEKIFAPCDGEIIPLEGVSDEVFSSGMMGEGFAVLPEDTKFYSPVSGRVENAYKTGHAYTIVTDDGLDVLVHIGIDTVELEGKFFEKKAMEGDYIKAGEIIATAEVDKILESGFDPVCVVVVSNSERMHSTELKIGKCTAGDSAMLYEIK